MKLNNIADLFNEALPGKAFHYFTGGQNGNYLIWQEEKIPSAGYGDNKKILRKIQGTADYFTKLEEDPAVTTIEAKMTQSKLNWESISIQFEEKTKYIHYEWSWEAIHG